MKKIVLSLFILFLPAITQAEEAYTLEDCFQASLKRSETVAIQKELIVQTEEQYKQGIGRIMPEITGVASYFRQQPKNTSSSSSSGTSSGTTGSSSSSQRNALSIAKISATQPIFRGFREFAYLRETKALKAGRDFDVQNASIQLYNDVAQSFYTIISLEHELRDLNEETKLYEKRIQELTDRQRIGRSRSSEVLNVKASLATLMAQREELQGRLQPEREVLFFLTGLPRDATLSDSDKLPEGFPGMDDYLQQLENRPDVKAEQERVRAAKEAVSIAWGGHSPSLDATGNYYFVHTDSLHDLDRQSNWDAQVTLSIPIFSGGALQSKVRESQSLKRQAELSLQQKRRLAEEEIRSLYQSLSSNLAQTKAYQEANELSERNYQVQTKDYRNGLVTNLDVLASLTSLSESRRDWVRSLYAAKISFARLESAIAKRPTIVPIKKPS